MRHGEGEHNVNKLYSLPTFSLTEKGNKQAETLAQRLTSLPIDLIVASSFKRARQTSEIINTKLNKKVIYTNLATEIRRPKEIAGKSWEDKEVIKIRQLLDENFGNPNWRYSDEENFFDLKKRAEAFLKYLDTFGEKNILVVSHVNFIKMAFLVMMLKEDLNPSIFLRAYDFLQLQTSGLTICQKENTTHTTFGTRKKTEWEAITWNDQSHLAE